MKQKIIILTLLFCVIAINSCNHRYCFFNKTKERSLEKDPELSIQGVKMFTYPFIENSMNEDSNKLMTEDVFALNDSAVPGFYLHDHPLLHSLKYAVSIQPNDSLKQKRGYKEKVKHPQRRRNLVVVFFILSPLLMILGASLFFSSRMETKKSGSIDDAVGGCLATLVYFVISIAAFMTGFVMLIVALSMRILG